jgi:glucose-1-phosphate cytidylyltransferase
MKVVLLAGGFGTRLSEETVLTPKPMVEIGGRPILWHIMKYYSMFNFKEFYIALGYKGECIKRYFIDYQATNRSICIHLEEDRLDYLDNRVEDWTINLIDTGLSTNTGGRLKRLQPFLQSDVFMLSYGDGVSTVDLNDLLRFHTAHGCMVTITAVHPPARFGGLDLEDDTVANFFEKSQIREGWINGGFMVFNPCVFDYIEGDQTVLEADVLEKLTAERQVRAYRHEHFWQCMDTLRDKRYLEELWAGGAPWKIW